MKLAKPIPGSGNFATTNLRLRLDCRPAILSVGRLASRAPGRGYGGDLFICNFGDAEIWKATFDGSLDAPSECIRRGNRLYVANIDLTYGPNTSDDIHTIPVFELP